MNLGDRFVYPISCDNRYNGMTYREYLVGQVLQGYWVNPNGQNFIGANHNSPKAKAEAVLEFVSAILSKMES